MDFRDTPAEAAFRKEVREWFEAHVPPVNHGLTFDEQRDWQRLLAAAGWVGIAGNGGVSGRAGQVGSGVQ